MKLSKRDVVLAGLGAITYLASQSGEAATTSAHPAGEGYAPVVGGRVRWRVARSGPRTPLLLLLHGGPGAGHDYLEPLSALADERPVIFYDQLACGRSDRPDDASMWHIEHFVEEIDALRQALRLHQVVLYGHSWGLWLAQEYLARRGGTTHVDALIPASTSACICNRFLSTVKS
jgi:proline iminopeptidase